MKKQLLDKINALFDYRGFPELLAYSGIAQKEAKILQKQLINLQASIYYLDEYLEQNWKIEEKALELYWASIYKALNEMDISVEAAKEYCAQILRYQKHELDLRRNLLPTRLNTEFYYFYKSCDVKLMRRLLLEKLPKIHSLFSMADWRYFDLVTEINDDVTDLEEDMHSINGNLVLIAYHQFGRDASIDIFNSFLDYCAEKSSQRFRNDINPYKQLIHNKTLEQIKVTKRILTQSTALKTDSDSVLYQHLKSERA